MDIPVLVVVPVYRDWRAFSHLMKDLDLVGRTHGYRWTILAVNDGAALPEAGELKLPNGEHTVRSIEILELACNVGHQRAIAVGLVVASSRMDHACVVVMDADGEDRPSDVANLLQHQTQIAGPLVAIRQERSERWSFRMCYFLYRLMFRLLTGRAIRFGNFCVLPMGSVRHLIYRGELWNNLAATLLRTSSSIVGVPTNRGRRYDGSSRMNLEALAVHGLGAVAVFSDIVFLRILAAAFAFGGATVTAILVVVTIRLFTDLAIPGWASYMVGALLVMLFQAVIIALASMFLLLGNRSASTFIPATDAMRYLVRQHIVYQK